MPIKIKCTNPNCGKVLNAPDTLAGKKASCPSCKTTLTVPAATAPALSPAAAAAPPPAKPAGARSAPAAAPKPSNGPPPAPAPKPAAPPVAETPPPTEDAESLAASMLSDEPKAEEAAPTKFIEFTCEWCDERVKVDAALAGKQAPCPNPECRRITKIPALADPKKGEDWRNAPKKPVGARMDAAPAPEGAWGTATSRGMVSKESLEEAGALPERSAPVGVRTWIARGMVAAAVLVLLVSGTLFALRWMGGKREAALVQKALDATDGKTATLGGPAAGLVHLSAGRYYLRRKEPGSAKPAKGEAGALIQLGKARSRMSAVTPPNAECDALLIELALTQLDLGGSGKAIEERRRLSWRDTMKEAAQTLEAIPREHQKPSEARHEGIRLVARRLVKEGEAKLVDDLALQVTDGPQALAVVGLELLRAQQKDAAEQLLPQILSFYKTEQKPPPEGRQPPKKEPPLPLFTEVVALAYALDRGKELKPEPADSNSVDVGKAIAAVFRSAEEAQAQANKLPTAVMKVEALVGIADLLTNDGEAKSALSAAEQEVGKQPSNLSGAPWLLVRMVRRGLAAGLDEQTLLRIAGWIPAKSQLVGWAQLLIFREQLKKEKKAAEESMADTVDKGSLSHRLARVELARHNTALDKNAAKAVDNWDNAWKPYGSIGAAMGLQGGE